MFIAQAQAFQCRKYMNIAGKRRQLKRREYALTPPVRVCFVIAEEVSLCLCLHVVCVGARQSRCVQARHVLALQCCVR